MKKSILTKILVSLSAGLASAVSSFLPVEASRQSSSGSIYSIIINVTWAEDAYYQPVQITVTKSATFSIMRYTDFYQSPAQDIPSLESMTWDGTAQTPMYAGNIVNDIQNAVWEKYIFTFPSSFTAYLDETTASISGNRSMSYTSTPSEPSPSDKNRISVTSKEGEVNGTLKPILDLTTLNFSVAGFDNDSISSNYQGIKSLVLTPNMDSYVQCSYTTFLPTFEYRQEGNVYYYTLQSTIIFTPKYVDLQLRKTWDASVPESERHPVTVHLTRDGEIYPTGNSFTLSADNHWTVTDDSISHLLQYNPETGEPYNYSLIEDGNAYQTSTSMTTSGSTVTVELINAKASSTPVPAVTDKSPVPNTSAEF